MDNLVLDIQFSNESLVEPVTLPEARSWLKLDVSDDDTIVTELITVARQQCEGFLNISLISRTVTAWLQIGLDEIRLPYGPVKTITSVTNYKGDPIAGYQVKYELFKALDPCTEVKTVYDAGFNGSIPKQFKTAIKEQIAWLYTNRGDAEVTETLSPIAKKILAPYRRVI
jgi:hypothetical protein